MISLARSGATTVVLRSPELGDGILTQRKVKVQHMMSGAILTYQQNVAITNRLTMRFNHIVKTKVDALELLLTVGQDNITLVDWLSRTWLGNVISNPIEYECTGNNGCEDLYSFTLDYQGTIQ
jgi:hypothetical protein